MSSVFSFDNWDTLLESTPNLASVDPTPMGAGSSTTPASQSSGEYHPFASIGNVISGGGGAEKPFLCFILCQMQNVAMV
jgi:hypothetical protein